MTISCGDYARLWRLRKARSSAGARVRSWLTEQAVATAAACADAPEFRVLSIGSGTGEDDAAIIEALLASTQQVIAYESWEPNPILIAQTRSRLARLASPRLRVVAHHQHLSAESASRLRGDYHLMILCQVLYYVNEPSAVLGKLAEKCAGERARILIAHQTRAGALEIFKSFHDEPLLDYQSIAAGLPGQVRKAEEVFVEGQITVGDIALREERDVLEFIIESPLDGVDRVVRMQRIMARFAGARAGDFIIPETVGCCALAAA